MKRKGTLTWEYLAAVVLVLIIVIVLLLFMDAVREAIIEQKDKFFKFVKEFIGL